MEDIEKGYAAVGFSGCGGAIECMCMICKNFPAQLKFLYHDTHHGKLATIIAQAWCDWSLYAWSWSAGSSGTINELIVLDLSPFLTKIVTDAFEFSKIEE